MTVICIAEDRQSEEASVKLLLLSLVRHCPGVKVILTFPPANSEFQRWVQQFPQIELHVEPIPGFSGWNIKPQALLSILRSGHEEVWWIDSDVILSSDFRQHFKDLPADIFVVSEEAAYGGAGYYDEGRRARGWQFEVGRVLPFALNSGVMRVTPAHIPLLEQWKRMLDSDIYRQAQAGPWEERAEHLFGDQDLLTALLTSKNYVNIPLKFIYRGRDIIQYFGPAGYSPKERMLNLFTGLPPFIHYQGSYKPWRMSNPPTIKNVQTLYEFLYIELAPYCYAARPYKDEVYQHLTWDWLGLSSPFGTALKILGLNHPALTGLPLALFYSFSHVLKILKSNVTQLKPRHNARSATSTTL